MARPTDAVVAGSKGFALALFAPLAERVGSRPRIAPEPQQALALCAASSGVLVVEYGPEWLPVLQQLRRQAIGLRVIAAVPRGQEAAALQLATIGADAVPWDGQPGPVLLAIDRLVAAPATPPRPAEAAPARPAVTPAAGSPAQPVPPRPAVTPPAGSPAQPAPPRLAVTPPAGSPSQPGQPRPAVTPPAGSPAQPAPPRLAVTPPAGSPAQVPSTAPALAPPPPAAAAPAAGGMDDLFSGYEASGEPPAPGGPAAAAQPGHAPSLAPGAAAPPPSHLPVPLAAGHAPPAAPQWPALVTGEEEAEAALVLGLRGALKPEAPLAGVAAATLASLSELERQVLGGAAMPFDTQPVYRAAVLRLRVASALATVPPPPAQVDGAAVQQLLGELDAVLADVKPLAAEAPPEHQLALEAVRNALVREAVNFSEAAHRLGEGGEPAPVASVRPHGPAAAATPRVLSVQAGADVVDERETRRRRIIWAIFAAVLLVGAAVHGVRYFQKERAIAALPTMPGAPDGLLLLPSRPGGAKVLVPMRGGPDRQQVEKFKAQQLLMGYQVQEGAGGVLTVTPLPSPTKGEKSP